MRMTAKRMRLTVLLATAGTVVPLAFGGSASAAGAGGASNDPNPPINGTIAGFTNGDFAYLDALNVGSLSLAQLSLAQSAAGVSNHSLQTVNSLGEDLLTTKSGSGHNAYGRAAGVSLNLGQGSAKVPQVQLTQAETVSPPPNQVKTSRILNLPLAPVANVDVQPNIATANTPSDNNFCVLGVNHPLSAGQATIADADVLPVTSAESVLSVDGTVQNNSLEELAPNNSGALGLDSATLLHTADIQLFKGIPGATISIKVINPLVLQAFAGGDGSSFVTYGSGDKQKDVLSITAGGQTVTLTAEQLLGGNGLTIDVDGLLRVQIGGKPTMSVTNDKVSALADLISVQVISLNNNTASSVGGPLAPLLNPILTPVLSALNGATQAIDKLLTSLGIKAGVDLRVGHFEANAQVPAGGIHCNIPVSKTPSTQNVTAGNPFSVTLTADNPYSCTIQNLKFEDKIQAQSGDVKWNVTNTSPKADSGSTNSDLVWSGLGSIPAGGHKSVTVTINVPADSPSGELEDTAIVTGTCATGNGPGTANVHLGGTVTLHGPTIEGTGPKTVVKLPDTGSSPWLPIGGGLLAMTGLGLVAMRRRTIG
ncbi:MAG TPA: LPXTG cell wall anchor domain-containing protein [Mycobacteriales bacterium]|nr:LPXTG cell wall anchor domain-containing protein [Mycobacteriales bacterium]